MHQSLEGRLVVRRFSSPRSAIAGVIQFAPGFTPQEDALYLASLHNGAFSIIGDPIEGVGIPESSGMGVDALLRSNCWRATSEDDFLTVRFIEAFPESNRWTVVGAASKPLLKDLAADEIGQVWLDISHCAMKQVPPLSSEVGTTLGILLSKEPIWPGPDGAQYAVPIIESRWRQAYLDHNILLARHGAGELTKEQLIDAVRADPAVFHIRSYGIDIEYCRYLARLRDAGGLTINRPLSADEIAQKDEITKRVLIEPDEEDEADVSPARRAPARM